MKKLKWTAGILLLLFAVIQLFRPVKNQGDDQTADISQVVSLPDSIHTLLQQACYDCHSNYTHYPWYAQIQPVGWWLANHVNEGKKELNFHEFGKYPSKRQLHKLKEMKEQIVKGEMPLSSYTLVHKEAIWTPAQQQAVINWIDSTAGKIR
ncbi:heme-binding domain-containing protein [Chitinophaga qingshengii]|uniref:Heme-binding domain-containing protein n=1 Tax=Chitinophaga qingshengii TaxID=1569794 RepID=A0ABR7TFI4_9BACT|nr:heme-binding domain-containing protein [Chitinophaga qingshengii]MBC9929087.1 heme-binding domain-containing protein [Chitinophaga qingshengii]